MAHKFYGINSVDGLEVDFSDSINEEIVYVDVDAQSNTRKKSEKLMLLFTKEQLQFIYDQVFADSK